VPDHPIFQTRFVGNPPPSKLTVETWLVEAQVNEFTVFVLNSPLGSRAMASSWCEPVETSKSERGKWANAVNAAKIIVKMQANLFTNQFN